MSEDLPIYSDSTLRTRLQFADLDRFNGVDTTPAWYKADSIIEKFEGASNVRCARESVQGATKSSLLQIHSTIFDGQLRRQPMRPMFRGQDCPDPQFIDRSLDNFFNWLTAESVAQIHPIERTALVL